MAPILKIDRLLQGVLSVVGSVPGRWEEPLSQSLGLLQLTQGSLGLGDGGESHTSSLVTTTIVEESCK